MHIYSLIKHIAPDRAIWCWIHLTGFTQLKNTLVTFDSKQLWKLKTCSLSFNYIQNHCLIWLLWIYLLQCRLAATIRCLCHPSAHVRTLSVSVLRDILHTGSIRCSPKPLRINGNHNPSYPYFKLDVVDWQADIEKCLTCEAHSRISAGLPIKFLDTAAKELGCAISIWNGNETILVCDHFSLDLQRNYLWFWN